MRESADIEGMLESVNCALELLAKCLFPKHEEGVMTKKLGRPSEAPVKTVTFVDRATAERLKALREITGMRSALVRREVLRRGTIEWMREIIAEGVHHAG